MTVNDSWNAVYEVRSQLNPKIRQGFERKEDAIEYADSIRDLKSEVYVLSVHIDGEGYQDEVGSEDLIWTPEKGEIEIEVEDPGAAWKKKAAERREVEWDPAEIMGISEWEEPECEEGAECDPFDCFGEDDGRFSDREGRFEGSPLRTLDPEELLKSLADELGVDVEVVEKDDEVEWPKPEAEEEAEIEEKGEEPAKTEIVVKAEVPAEVADDIEDGEVEVKVEKEGEIPEVSAEKEEVSGEKPKISEEDPEEIEGDSDEEAEEGEKIEESAKLEEESEVEAALKAFESSLGESLEEGEDMTDLELAERLEFARRRRRESESE